MAAAPPRRPTGRPDASRTRPRAEGHERPSILVAYHPYPGGEAALRELCAGIEEEGVPYKRVGDDEERDAAAIAHSAASESRLLVGVGLDSVRACVHLSALAADAPLLSVDLGASTPDDVRNLGHNAARLVSIMPLKGAIEARAAAARVLTPAAAPRVEGEPATATPPDVAQ